MFSRCVCGGWFYNRLYRMNMTIYSLFDKHFTQNSALTTILMILTYYWLRSMSALLEWELCSFSLLWANSEFIRAVHICASSRSIVIYWQELLPFKCSSGQISMIAHPQACLVMLRLWCEFIPLSAGEWLVPSFTISKQYNMKALSFVFNFQTVTAQIACSLVRFWS